jgi:hypothetical protein
VERQPRRDRRPAQDRRGRRDRAARPARPHRPAGSHGVAGTAGTARVAGADGTGWSAGAAGTAGTGRGLPRRAEHQPALRPVQLDLAVGRDPDRRGCGRQCLRARQQRLGDGPCDHWRHHHRQSDGQSGSDRARLQQFCAQRSGDRRQSATRPPKARTTLGRISLSLATA